MAGHAERRIRMPAARDEQNRFARRDEPDQGCRDRPVARDLDPRHRADPGLGQQAAVAGANGLLLGPHGGFRQQRVEAGVGHRALQLPAREVGADHRHAC
ncbi:MAG: hypothetical protein NVS3B2_07190 [Ramlibacter sp.]